MSLESWAALQTGACGDGAGQRCEEQGQDTPRGLKTPSACGPPPPRRCPQAEQEPAGPALGAGPPRGSPPSRAPSGRRPARPSPPRGSGGCHVTALISTRLRPAAPARGLPRSLLPPPGTGRPFPISLVANSARSVWADPGCVCLAVIAGAASASYCTPPEGGKYAPARRVASVRYNKGLSLGLRAAYAITPTVKLKLAECQEWKDWFTQDAIII